jgi:hypothetical protein
VHLIADKRALPFGDEAMLVMPKFIRTFQLDINEAVGWIPFNNLGSPVNRDTLQRNEYLISVPLRTAVGSNPES